MSYKKINFMSFEQWKERGCLYDIDFLSVKFTIANSTENGKNNITVFTHYTMMEQKKKVRIFGYSEKGYEDACKYIEDVRLDLFKDLEDGERIIDINKILQENKILKKALKNAVVEIHDSVDQFCNECNYFFCEHNSESECVNCNMDYFIRSAEDEIRMGNNE